MSPLVHVPTHIPSSRELIILLHKKASRTTRIPFIVTQIITKHETKKHASHHLTTHAHWSGRRNAGNKVNSKTKSYSRTACKMQHARVEYNLLLKKRSHSIYCGDKERGRRDEIEVVRAKVMILWQSGHDIEVGWGKHFVIQDRRE